MGEGERHQRRWDVIAAGAATAFALAAVIHEMDKKEFWLPVAAAVPLAILTGLALLARRRYPIPVTLFTGSMTVLFIASDSRAGTVALLIALYSLAKYERRWIAIVAGSVVIVVGTVTAGLSGSWEMASRSAPWLVIFLEAGIIAGDIAGRQQRALESARSRAAEAERSKEELAQRRAAEERVRIARELHDSLTHAISVVNVQSSVALHMLNRQPEQAEASLRNIRAASQDAMRELRATLRALRMTEGDSTPGIDSLPALVERSALTIAMDISPDRQALPETVDRTVYRIVQEALTNSTRHARASAVDISIVVDDESVTTTITDDGIGPAPEGVAEGLGLMGMRVGTERV